MPEIAESEASLIEAIHALPEEGRRAVLSYALFLRQQEEERRLQAEDATWNQSFNNPARMANFKTWADQSLAAGPAEPIDRLKL